MIGGRLGRGTGEDRNEHGHAGKALVLGGGGVTGVAWELGVLAGLADAGLDFDDADLVVGTSAGSVVAAQLTSGQPLDARCTSAQLAPPTTRWPPGSGPASLLRSWHGRADHPRPAAGPGRSSARWRCGPKTMPEAERRAVIESRLPATGWPEPAAGVITAVAADDGEFVVFDRDAGVSLVDAVGASCAVPGVWPPVTINGRRYMDGGMRAPANVDLAAGYDRVVVLAPLRRRLPARHGPRSAQVGRAGPAHAVRGRDARTRRRRAAIGRNVLDPAAPGAPRPGPDSPRRARVLDAVKQVWQG